MDLVEEEYIPDLAVEFFRLLSLELRDEGCLK
jgi:hypothetical protein